MPISISVNDALVCPDGYELPTALNGPILGEEGHQIYIGPNSMDSYPYLAHLTAQLKSRLMRIESEVKMEEVKNYLGKMIVA